MSSNDQSPPMRGQWQPPSDAVVSLPQLWVASHPVSQVLLTELRDTRTPRPQFARAARELTRQLLWEALENAPTTPVQVPSHTSSPTTGKRLAHSVAAVAILRAGLGMVEPIQQIVPDAPVYQLGIQRDEATLEPHIYYTNVPASLGAIDHLLLLDPMLATGGSASAAVRILRRSYTGRISYLGILGAPLGVHRLTEADSEIRIFLAALDDHLDDRGFIIPGLGDAGDRLFGTH